ncbi:MAG: HPr(Ser) kinase/phosphatase [Deltaproteobacteria bacterium]|jgi:HPr kinase/phosphorylase|nr:HPr(Ser) kinase/phosphatase [Deltaproteobacteria bacterium]
MPEVSVRRFYEHVKGPLGMTLLAGEPGLGRLLRTGRIQKPGLAFTGHTAFVHSDRVQILGQTELSFVANMTPEGRVKAIESLLACQVACIVVTKGMLPPAELVEGCARHQIPLLSTRVTSSECIRRILAYLDDLLSPRISLHGVLVDVSGIGVLITGSSGIGKSETALELVSRGHRLVADDVVEIRRRGEDLVGQASTLIQNLIEIRGLGILNIAELFGVSATRDHKRIELHIELENWSDGAEYDRIGLEDRTKDILGVRVRSLVVPVRPGRSVVGIVEVAARNFLLRLRGHHAPAELNRRIQEAMQAGPGASPSFPTLGGAAELTEVSDHIEDEVE